MNEKPKRCIDAVLKRCESCPFGVVEYPEWVETYEDLAGCCYETSCIYDFENDVPTQEELKNFGNFLKSIRE